MSFSKAQNLVSQKKVLKLNFRKKDDRPTTSGNPLDDDGGDLTFNAKDFQHLNKKDVVRLASVQDENVSIFLQVAKSEEFVPKNNVCISEDVVSSIFPFKRYSEVYVEQVQPAEISLDLLEMTFKEQYISRSDMCRIRRFLLNRCVYLGGKLEFCLMRLKVGELWRKGLCVSSGYVGENTRVVFRSSSALVFIFVQMSLEMWDYDSQGVCYYEKCFDGFLTELFRRWRNFECSHYVTIVLFSRWFYVETKSLQDFPSTEAHKIQKDFRGRFYQDFYQVLIQNEHYEDWLGTLGKIKCAFYKYAPSIQSHMTAKGMPPAENSTAGDGNVLEALNMTFNVFSTHNVDRNFERTGQAVILITPGDGVFNVDRTFANLTKERNFDYGIAVDLVCLGEQPLHAVPLLIYHSKTTAKGKPPEIEDYFIMHWINYSYYNPMMYPNPLAGSYRPRIKVPSEMLSRKEHILLIPPAQLFTSASLSAYPDFEAYDNFVNSAVMPKRRQHKSSVPQLSPNLSIPLGRRLSEDDGGMAGAPTCSIIGADLAKIAELTIETPDAITDSHFVNDECLTSHNSAIIGSCPIDISCRTRNYTKMQAPRPPYKTLPPTLEDVCRLDRRNFNAVQATLNLAMNRGTLTGVPAVPAVQSRGFYSPCFTSSGELGAADRFRVNSYEGRNFSKQSASMLEAEEVRRPLINPFKPSEFSVRITSNRRRWIHVFPVDSRGLSKQSHHSVAGTSIFYAALEEPDLTQVPEAPLVAIDKENDSAEIVAMRQKSPDKLTTFKESTFNSANISASNNGKTLIWAWGCTGEEQWNPDIEVGTDWKSMVVPSCLPITTDFFPDARSLKYDYLFSEHTILVDESVRDIWRRPAQPTHQPTAFVGSAPFSQSFNTNSAGMFEQDFRLNVFNELVAQRLQQGFQVVLLPLDMLNSAITVGCGPTLVPEKVCYLSISRIYHRLSLVGQCIYVTKFFPRHLYPLKSFSCLYECQFEHHDHLEKLNWSSMDNLVVLQGETDDYLMRKDTKFWEARFFLVPSYHPATPKITSSQSKAISCDIYCDIESPDLSALKFFDSFIKFMEALNRIRRPANLVRLCMTKSDDGSTFDSQEVDKILQLANSSNSRHALNFIQSASIFGSSNSPTQKWPAERLFVGAEFAHWLLCHVTDLSNVREATLYAQRLLVDKKIRHVSGQDQQRFVYGFYLYFFVGWSTTGRNCDVINNNNNFTNTLYEVAFIGRPCESNTSANFCFRRFRTYKYFFDPGRRSERQEWGQIRLNGHYWPGCVFELNFQWLVATGAVVNDCLMQLHRKSVVYPLCLLPVPKDPFALPDDPHSDPLRCPIFLALSQPTIESLVQAQIDRLRLEILHRYGFVPMSCEIHEKQMFFHSSAGMSLMLKDKFGFLWKWNHALGHRYRSSSTTGDEKYLDAMLADFRTFCNNSDGRLRNLIDKLFLSR